MARGRAAVNARAAPGASGVIALRGPIWWQGGMILRRLAALALLALAAAPARAETVRFDLIVAGITAGQLALSAEESGGAYAVRGSARATGPARALVRKTYDGTARGAVAGGTLRPARYDETETERGGTSTAALRFEGGRPVGIELTPPPEPRPWDLDPGAVRGASDPLTVLWAMARPVAAGAACGTRHDIFDGRRLSRLTLSAPEPAGDGALTCAARYERLAGYSPEELAERDGARFALRYAPRADGRVELVEMRAPTPLGDAVLRRR